MKASSKHFEEENNNIGRNQQICWAWSPCTTCLTGQDDSFANLPKQGNINLAL